MGLAIPGPVPALRRARRTRRTCRPASTAGTSTPPTARRWRSKAGRAVPLVVGNDGAFGGVGEAQRVRGAGTGGVLMLAPGLGPRLGLHRRARAAAAGRHARRAWRRRTCRRRCTCWARSRTRAAAAGPGAASSSTPRWPGCPTCWPSGWRRCPDHPLAKSTETPQREGAGAARPRPEGRRAGRRAVRLPGARDGAAHRQPVLALDPEFVVIGGGLMDPENTSDAFRERYLRHRARDRPAAPLAGAARAADDPAVDAGRAVAGDRRRAGRALPQPAVAPPKAPKRTRYARLRPRVRDADFACRESDVRVAAPCPSRFSARAVASERARDGLFGFRFPWPIS